MTLGEDFIAIVLAGVNCVYILKNSTIVLSVMYNSLVIEWFYNAMLKTIPNASFCINPDSQCEPITFG